LTGNTPYYVRAYATNIAGTAYGSQVSFTTTVTGTVPTVITTNITNITQTTATGVGDVIAQGSSSVTARGVCWSASSNPTTSNTHTTDGSGTGSFTSSLTGLTGNTPYYVRAYATNIAGTAYGIQLSFTTTGTGTVPTVTTDTITNITQTTATGGGNVTAQGSSSVTARGVCWSASSNPTIFDSHITDGSGTGSFTINLTGLTAFTPYYVRAYATNIAGTAYGNEVNFTTTGSSGGQPCPGTPTVLYEGKTYNTILIGTQCWLKENLNVGTRIIGLQSQYGTNGIKEKYCYDDLESNCAIYGGLYQWDEFMQGSTTPGVQGICPQGWHVPTDVEWTILTDFLGGEGVAGGKMKEAGTAHWAFPNIGATNSSGYTALPGGYRNWDGHFYASTSFACFWSSTDSSSAYAWHRYLWNDNEKVGRLKYDKTDGFSARCVQD
jgi:uncharacterized protein (TIGR02145 family)